MRTTAAITIILMIPLAVAFGQQDSLIIDSVAVDSGQGIAGLGVWGVTFDSVEFYSVGLRCNDPFDSNCYLAPPLNYFPPISSWVFRYDTVTQDWIRFIGLCNPFDSVCLAPLFTQGERVHLWTMRIMFNTNGPPRVITIDTVGDFSFGNNPIFRRGYIVVGNPVSIKEDGQVPLAFELSQNYPNPFNSSTTMDFSLFGEYFASLMIYDLLGRHVKTLFAENLSAGSFSILWNGKNEAGIDMPSGIYFYRLITNKGSDTRRMTLIK